LIYGQSPKRALTFIVVIAASLLGAGTATGSAHEPTRSTPVESGTIAVAISAPSNLSHAALGVLPHPDLPDSLAGPDHHDHRDERLDDDQHEIGNVPPNTLSRFHSGNT
jgi:hypothetical protein